MTDLVTDLVDRPTVGATHGRTTAAAAVGGGVLIAGWGHAVPERRVTNHDLARHLDTSDDWIVERTGIRERRLAGPGESTGPLAIAAARMALDRAAVTPTEVDLVIVATSTPERPLPATAALVAAELGATAGAFDLNAACAGFVYGLASGAALVAQGVARTVLLVGADTMSSIIDPDDRSTAVLFGDGAAACVLVGAGADREAGRAIESSLPPDVSVLNLIGRTDLRLLIGVLARCRAFVSNDSGAMHLAAAAGVPVTAIFGPTNERATAPLGEHDVLLEPVFCRPCMLRECPIDHRCMKRISPDAVFASVARRL
ncbi:MAG TPA: glycosyltransferase family 9 protein [Acidimicrobiales bacterium]|nr:glycosyltransferase family 9 protein [Acidimicrobiales bacterium]